MYQTLSRFAPPDTPLGRVYAVDVLRQSTLGGKSHEQKISYKVGKERILVADNRLVNNYQMDVLQRKADASHPLQALENELAEFQSSIVLGSDAEGRPTAILNRREIRDMWELRRKAIAKKYAHIKGIADILKETDALLDDRERFLKVFTESDLATVLFPDIYGDSLETVRERTEEKTFTDFIGEVDLPLLLTVSDYKKKMEDKVTKHQVRRTGRVNVENYDAKRVKAFFERIAKATAQTQTTLNVEYKELYDLDRDFWITHVGQMFRAEIKGLFRFQQIIRVRPLTE